MVPIGSLKDVNARDVARMAKAIRRNIKRPKWESQRSTRALMATAVKGQLGAEQRYTLGSMG